MATRKQASRDTTTQELEIIRLAQENGYSRGTAEFLGRGGQPQQELDETLLLLRTGGLSLRPVG